MPFYNSMELATTPQYNQKIFCRATPAKNTGCPWMSMDTGPWMSVVVHVLLNGTTVTPQTDHGHRRTWSPQSDHGHHRQTAVTTDRPRSHFVKWHHRQTTVTTDRPRSP